MRLKLSEISDLAFPSFEDLLEILARVSAVQAQLCFLRARRVQIRFSWRSQEQGKAKSVSITLWPNADDCAPKIKPLRIDGVKGKLLAELLAKLVACFVEASNPQTCFDRTSHGGEARGSIVLSLQRAH